MVEGAWLHNYLTLQEEVIVLEIIPLLWYMLES